jgi:serine/threonine protein kinase
VGSEWSLDFVTSLAVIYQNIIIRLKTKIIRGIYEFIPERNISDEALDFVSRLLTVDMATRMTASEALEHPWVRYFLIHNFYSNLLFYVFKLKSTIPDICQTFVYELSIFL